MNKTIVIGAGVAGLGAFYADNNVQVYEAQDNAGGLCASFEIDGFWFDNAVHLSFTNNEFVKDILSKTAPLIHHPTPVNWYKDKWIQHPIQNNLYKLSVEERVNAVQDFITKNEKLVAEDYYSWNLSKYGKYITDNFIKKYNDKYWCEDMSRMGIQWIGNRVYQPSLKEVLYGSYTDKTPNTYYAKEMRYPKENGYYGFWKNIVSDADAKKAIFYNKRVNRISAREKRVYFTDGTSCEYDKIFSSMPLTECVNIVENISETTKNQAKKLNYTSVMLVSVAICKENILPYTWFYIYDEDIMAARCYVPSNKSPQNVPKGYSSIQFEIYFNSKEKIPTEEACKENVVYSLEKMKIADKKDILFMQRKYIKYANIIFYPDTETVAKNIRDELYKLNIIPIGRFGEWKYFWSDQAFLSGYQAASKENTLNEK